MKTVVIDAATLGEGLDFSCFDRFGETAVYDKISPDKFADAVKDADIIVVNKTKLNQDNLKYAENLKLICEFATGYDNIDVEYCKRAGIGAANVKGYSTYSVAQLTISMALYLTSHMPEYTQFVKTGEYSRSGIQNMLSPVYHELYGKTWGIVGLGNIGRQVALCAKALGCKILAYKRTPTDEYKCTDLDTLCRSSDIISVHTPLTEETRGLISREKIALMKKDAVFINVARGAVADEKALADAIKEERLGGIGIDVYSTEPFPSSHPFTEIMNRNNVCLTPHMAWGAYEARIRCLNEIVKNIEDFKNGGTRNRIDL